MTGGAALAPDLSRAVNRNLWMRAPGRLRNERGGRRYHADTSRDVAQASVGRSRLSGQRAAHRRFRDARARARRRPGGGHGPEPQRHARVSGRRRGDARRPRPRRLAAHGRRRLPRSGRVPLPRGPKEGPRHPLGIQRVSPRGRGGPVRVSRRAGSGGGGHPRRRARRGGGRADRPRARTASLDPKR